MTDLAISAPVASTNGAGASAVLAAGDLDSELRGAFLLGATISELQGRIRVAALDRSLGRVPDAPSADHSSARASFVPYVEADSSIARATSTWRVLFERLSMLHKGFFPDSSTRNTHYDPGNRLPPYFFPDQPDYADVGIAPEPDGTAVLTNFALREVTRRGLNSLVLLCIAPEVSLLPDVIREQQQRLIGSIPNPPEGADPREVAISVITQQVLLFLHAWEGFLRESFFAAGVSPRNENNLIAFEAGLNMAWLSWGISAECLQDPGAPPEKVAQTWREAFRDSAISRLQHQVAIVGKALDDTHSTGSGGQTTHSQVATRSVKRSLDYWQRTVGWLAGQQAAGKKPNWDKLRLALIEQSGIWQALVLGQQNVECYSAEGVCQKVLQDLAPAFERLAAGRGLFGAAAQVGEQLSAEVRLASSQLQRAAGVLVRSIWPLIAAFAALAVLGAVFFFIHLATTPGANVLADVATFAVGAAGAAGLLASRLGLRSTATPAASTTSTSPAAANATPNLLDRLSSLSTDIGSTLLADLNRGFDKVQEDLKQLGYAVGVSYPLIEFFVLDTQEWRDFRADVDFMNKVIWIETERRQELVDVAAAAFGPLGFFAVSTASGSGSVAADEGQPKTLPEAVDQPKAGVT